MKIKILESDRKLSDELEKKVRDVAVANNIPNFTLKNIHYNRVNI